MLKAIKQQLEDRKFLRAVRTIEKAGLSVVRIVKVKDRYYITDKDGSAYSVTKINTFSA